MALGLGSTSYLTSVAAFGQSPTHNTAGQITGMMQPTIPRATLVYNNQHYDMFPFVFVDNGQLNKILLPAVEADNGIPLTLLQGSTLSFQFSKQPIRVDAFVADYDGDVPALIALRKLGFDSFELTGPQGIYNIEVHAFFADGQYTSYTLIADIWPTASIGGQPATATPTGLSTQFGTPNGANSGINSGQIIPQQPCERPTRLDVKGVSASNQNTLNSVSNQSTLNLPENVLDNNLGTLWSVRGINVMSFVKTLPDHFSASASKNQTLFMKNPWIQLDLGADKTVCNIGIAFDNGDNSVNFFTVQTSEDGVHFKNVGTAQSTPIRTGGQLYEFADLPITAEFIRITNLGNIVAGPIGVAEIIAVGN